ncbi:MAG: hypothetical protein ABI432_08360 [Flavobacteriales bacterium]
MRVRDQFTGHTGAVYALVHDRSPGIFLSGSGDGTVVRWDRAAPEKGELLARTDQAVFSLCRLLEPDRLVIGGENGDLRVIDLSQRRELQLLRFHRKGIFRIVVLPGERIACAGGDGVLSVWSCPTLGQPHSELTLLRSIPLIEDKLRDIALRPTGEQIAVACGDSTVRILETMGFNELHTIEGHERGATAVAWHPLKPVLITGGKDGHLRFWHAEEGFRSLRSIAAHRSTIYRIVFDAEGAHCMTTSRDKTAKLWTADAFEPIARLDRRMGGHALSVNDAIWMDDDPITAGDDRRVVRWTEQAPPPKA